MKRIDLIAGARPNFMKIAPIIDAIRQACDPFAFRLVHTGQHYDRNMSGSFFEQLGIPEPDVNLSAGGGTQAEQTAAIMTGYEALLARDPSDLCVVVGDVTSTMACAITAQKAHIPVAHVEGGIRSGDWAMPEEINRLVTDSVTDVFFTTTETADQNLLASGVPAERIHRVGNTMIDTLLAHRPRFTPPLGWPDFGARPGGYLVLTLHRPSNVDDPAKLRALLTAIDQNSRERPVFFPVHPRTRAKIDQLQASFSNLHLLDPLPYLEFNWLVEHAEGVVTDSGGITEETTVLGVPCMTLRTTTERPETVTLGTNELLGDDPGVIAPALNRLFDGNWKQGQIPPLWDGRAGQRIVAQLSTLFEKGTLASRNV